MIYNNPNYKKVRGSHILFVSCGYCKTDIAKYEKVGRGNLLRMKVNRIIKGFVDFSKNPGVLTCPNCNKQLGTRISLKDKNSKAYRMIRSVFNTRSDTFFILSLKIILYDKPGVYQEPSDMVKLKVTSDEVGNTSSVTNKRKVYCRNILTA